MILIVSKKKVLHSFLFLLAAVVCAKSVHSFWERKAVMANVSADTPSKSAYLSIVIDDFGYNGDGTEEMISLPIPFTAAIMPFSDYSVDNARAIHTAGKEAVIHLPMESLTGKKSWVGDKGIFKTMTDAQIKVRVEEAFEIVPNAVGLNNHMGSAIMEDERCFSDIMDCIKERNLIFIDSMTTNRSVGQKICEEKGIAVLKRDVFLDSTNDIAVVKKNLQKAASIALEKGHAVAIGHVGPEGGKITAQAIRELAPQFEQQGIVFVTASQMTALLQEKTKK